MRRGWVVGPIVICIGLNAGDLMCWPACHRRQSAGSSSRFASRRLIAPVVIIGNSTLVQRGRESPEAGEHGFTEATGQMIEHFRLALTQFEADVRAGKASVRAVHRAQCRCGSRRQTCI